MDCDLLQRQWGYTCQPVADGVLYAESPFVLVGDGSHLGAYIQDIGSNKVRLSDNADILFNALTYEVQLRKSTLKMLRSIAVSRGLELGDNGELHTVCSQSQLGDSFARFLEAAFMFGEVLQSKRPEPASGFERTIAKILSSKYGPRLSRAATVTGASGHELQFPFGLDIGRPEQQFIQTIAAKSDGSVNWRSVYQATGKFLDLKNNEIPGGRVVVIEPATNIESIHQAEVILQNAARVIEYTGPDHLLREIDLAA
ncbi:DUF1828 domain-containing protein [Marinobacter sp.]|uniref:DUF1828 domain-containing protein n=1 Tax=Marinobacter sp. TaxID=50741 RepID=UPI00384ED0DA